MATPDPVARAETAFESAAGRLRTGPDTADPHMLLAVGRLYVRLEAIRALSTDDPATAGLLAEQLIDAIARDLREHDPRAAIHAATGAALLGAA